MAPEKTYRSILRPDAFKGQLCLITGGGTGIGRQIAHELASLGASVALVGRREEVLAEAVDQIVSRGGSATYAAADIRDFDGVRSAVQTIVASHGHITCLVNNAGGQFPSMADEISASGWRSVIDLNLNGTFFMSRAVYDASMRANGGAIVSIVAPVEGGFPLFAHSGAARAAVINLTQTLATEWAPNGVRVNAVAPGVILSAAVQKYPPTIFANLEQRVAKTPAGRFGTESEVAAAVAFLLSPASSFTTGETLRVDGGSGLKQGPAKTIPKVALAPFEGFDS